MGLARAGQWSLRWLHRWLHRSLMAPVRGTCRVLGAARRGWARLPRFYRHLLVNLVVGVAIAVLLHAYHTNPLVHALDDAAIDWSMRMYRGGEPAEGTRPIAFIDIDEASWRRWGEPLLTPRDKLAALLRHAVDGGARAIVLDVDLVHPNAGDAALRAVLERWLRDAGPRVPDLPPLLLVRDLRLPPMGSDALPQERATAFDALVARAPGIHWAAPLFELDADGMVRRWRLWIAACGVDGRPLVRPSMQLLLAALLDGSEPEREGLTRKLEGFVPAACGGVASETAQVGQAGHGQSARDQADHGAAPGHAGHQGHGGETVSLGDRAFQLHPHGTAARVIYREPWRPAPGKARHAVLLDEQRVPVLSVRPAATVARTSDPRGSEWLRGHVAIIGGSHQETGDIYMTPLGWMPGSLILANAIQSFGHHGELRTPGLGMTVLVEAFLILVMSALFALFRSLLGSLLSGLAVLFVLLPASLWLFGYGIWLSFAIPLIAILLHKLFGEIEEFLGKSH